MQLASEIIVWTVALSGVALLLVFLLVAVALWRDLF